MTPDLYEHLHTNIRYSTQALPVNVLLDTLLRPNLDTGLNDRTCIEWRYEPENAVSHLVLGDASHAGGQWAEEPTSGDWNARALSYTEMLSLPGYTFDKHYQIRTGKPLPPFERPTRGLVADYYATYPKAIGIADAIRNDAHVNGVSRTSKGFYIRSHGVHCKNLVLASGVFKNSIVPPPLLRSKQTLDNDDLPLMVVGSGFSAADAIIAAPISRKIIHIFKWSPEDRPSPLRGCHRQAYPEYAGVYRQMKHAAERNGQPLASNFSSARMKQPKTEVGCRGRNWIASYEGLPNAKITDVSFSTNNATVEISSTNGKSIERQVGGLAYLVGRTGSLNYLDPELQTEVLALADRSTPMPSSIEFNHIVTGRSFRSKAQEDLQIVPGVFVAGSLTGDSLVRYAFGGCVQVAGTLMMNATPQGGNQDVRGAAFATTTAGSTAGANHADNPGNRNFEAEKPANNGSKGADIILASSLDNISSRNSSCNSSSNSSIHSQETQASQTTQSSPCNEMSNEMSVVDQQQQDHDGDRKTSTRIKSAVSKKSEDENPIPSLKENNEYSPSPSRYPYPYSISPSDSYSPSCYHYSHPG